MHPSADNKLYQTILDAINAGVWIWDIDSGEEWWSDKYYALLGYLPGEIKASYNCFLYELVHPDDRPLFVDENNNPVFIGINEPIEVRLKTRDGSYRWFEATGKLILNKQGRPLKMTGSIIDRNAGKALQGELQHSINVMGEQNKRLNNFAHIVSHNLRSHSSNMQSLLSLIDAREIADPKLEEHLRYLNNISVSLNETIDHLNELIKVQSAVDLSNKTLEFKTIYDLVINVLGPSIHNSHATIKADFSACPKINYVYAYLESILLNLFSNAIKYRHPDRNPVIEIKTYCKEEITFLEIKDNGLGIDLEKNREKLFGLYNVFHSHPDAKGIGLYITKNQVESLGGNISVISEPGKGSTFLVQF